MLKNRGVLGVLFGLISATLYGITPIFVYHATDHGADSFGLMCSRYIIAVVVLLVYRMFTTGLGKWPTKKLSLKLFLLGAIGLYSNSICMFTAFDYLPSGLAMVLFYFYPILVVIFGWVFFRHVPPKIIWPCLAITLLGVALSASKLSGGQAKGVAIIVFGAFAYAIYSVLAAASMPKTDLISGLILIFGGAGFSFVVVWLLDPPGLPTTMPFVADVWLPALEIGVVGTIGAMGIFFAGMNLIGASKSAVIQTWEVLVAICSGVFFLNQSFSIRQLFGAVLILSGVIVLLRVEAKQNNADILLPT
ncbi:MAG: DMT family transporter [Actinomycetota bacterium]